MKSNWLDSIPMSDAPLAMSCPRARSPHRPRALHEDRACPAGTPTNPTARGGTNPMTGTAPSPSGAWSGPGTGARPGPKEHALDQEGRL